MLAQLLVVAAFVVAQTAEPDAPARVTQREFKRLRAAQSILVVDTRIANTYRAGHIPGALSLPVEGASWPPEYEKAVETLKAATKPVIVYCGCVADANAVRAARLLKDAGVRDVRVLTGGWVEWFNGGNRVAKGTK